MTTANPTQRRRYYRHALKNLRAVRDAATPEQAERGRAWYPIARSIAADIGRYCGPFGDRDLGAATYGAGIIAALSPQTAWELNVTNAQDFARTGHLVSSAGYFTAQLLKAERIRDGAHPLDVLRGPKERGFFQSIMAADTSPVDEEEEEEHACIDRHMVAAAQVEQFGSFTPARYRVIEEATIAVAHERGEAPPTCQAIIWIVQRDSTAPTATSDTMPF